MSQLQEGRLSAGSVLGSSSVECSRFETCGDVAGAWTLLVQLAIAWAMLARLARGWAMVSRFAGGCGWCILCSARCWLGDEIFWYR